MSSGFVPAGSTENTSSTNDDWEKAKQDIEDARRRKEEAGRQEGGKSLFEVLQQNKAAKQEAFEESIKLKNQFRSLDEDEVEFLDLVLESTRAKEEAVKKETTEQLDIFRRQQEEADRALLLDQNDDIGSGGDKVVAADEEWKVSGRKRRRVGEKDNSALKGVKIRKSSSSTEKVMSTSAKEEAPLTKSTVSKNTPAKVLHQQIAHSEGGEVIEGSADTKGEGKQHASKATAAAAGLGLDYSSDEDDP